MDTDNAARRMGRLPGISRTGGLLTFAFMVALAISACGSSAASVNNEGRQAGPASPAGAPQALTAEGASKDASTGLQYGAVDSNGKPIAGDQALAADQTLIVKTGSLSLEVASVENALGQAQAAIQGMGGRVESSNRFGDGDNLTATVTYRLPVARWDDALEAIRRLGSKVISEQTGSTDVSQQVVDLDARLANLAATESALQAIMARATEIKDVLAVQDQLTQTRSQIEQLKAQRDYLSRQAAMSTLTVSFQLPAKTQTTQVTKDWDLGKEIDKAVAQLVKVGQGLASVAVWAVVVGLPIAIGLLILLGLLWLCVRIFRRSRGAKGQAPAAQA